MLKLKNVSKSYIVKNGLNVDAIKSISLEFPSQGMIFITGKSGSGKSTLLNLIGGLDTPTGGVIEIGNESIAGMDDKNIDYYRNTYVGFIFQEYNLLNHLTVGENIALALEMQNKAVTDGSIQRVLSKVQMEDYHNRKTSELSGGQKQRVAIARALVKEPRMIIADEPTGAVDSETGTQIFDILKALSKDKLVIVVSHDQEMAKKYADRMIELKDGKISSDTLKNSDKESEQLSVKFVPSSLSLKSAIKLGVHNIKKKKIRFLFVVLLSVISFTLFGMADLISSYDKQNVLMNSLWDADAKSVVAKKEKFIKYDSKSGWYGNGFRMEQEEIDQLSEESGISWKGIYKPEVLELNIEQNYGDTTYRDSQYGLYLSQFNGFVEFTEDDLSEYGFTLVAGTMPDGNKDEIAVSEYVYESFKMASYRDYSGPICTMYYDDGQVKDVLSWDEYRVLDWSVLKSFSMAEEPTCTINQISSPSDLIGRTIFIGRRNYKITGIIDTGFDIEEYRDMPRIDIERHAENMDALQLMKLKSIENERNYGAIGIAFVGIGKISEIASRYPSVVTIDDMTIILENEAVKRELTYNSIMKLSDVYNVEDNIHFMNPIEQLGKREIVLPFEDMPSYVENIDATSSIGYHWTHEKSSVCRNGWQLFLSYEDQRKSLSETEYVVVGVNQTAGLYEPDCYRPYNLQNVLILPDELYNEISEGREGTYKYIMASVPSDKEILEQFVMEFGRGDDNIAYSLQGEIVTELETIDEMLGGVSQIFQYISVVLAVFAMIMFFNFMHASINQDRKEIGIMRALGARNVDICRIFLCEGLSIAVINVILSNLLLVGATFVGNDLIKKELSLSLSVLQYGPKQFAMILVLSVAMAIIACVLPMKGIVKKNPAEIITS